MVDPQIAGVAGFAIVLGAAAAFVLAAMGIARGWWRHEVSFGLIGVAAFASIFAVFTIVRGWLSTAPSLASVDFVLGALGVLVGLAIVLLPVLFLIKVATSPWIHDITTDMENPPEFVAARSLRSKWSYPVRYEGEKVAKVQREKYPHIAPKIVDGSPEVVFERALAVARARGWEIVAMRDGEGVFEAVESTPLLGFKDDVVVRITGAGQGARVDMRSSSRVGDTDLGVNAKRIAAFLDAL